MSLATQVGPDTHVTLAYTLYGEDGEIIEKTDAGEPVTYVHGYGQIVPGLERGLEGLTQGQKRTVQVKPEDGYGEYDDEGVFEVDPSEFPDPKAIQVDDEFLAESPDGDSLALRVVEVRDDAVVVDANHPLAGVALKFEVEVLDVRAATAEEIAEAEAELEEDDACCDDPDHDHGHEHGEAAPLVGLGKKPTSGQPS